MNMVEFVGAKHAGQYRNDKDGARKVPYTEHLHGVASVVASALDLTNEVNDDNLRRDMISAALGHDLIEDTNATESEIVSVTNNRTLRFIKELTNPEDDAHTDRYMDQISAASEEARIIKYADLIENTMSVAYNLNILGRDWLEGFYNPILSRTTAVLQATEFVRYPKTADMLRTCLKINTDLLNDRAASVSR